MGIFYPEKIWKNDFAPSEKYACYAPDLEYTKEKEKGKVNQVDVGNKKDQ